MLLSIQMRFINQLLIFSGNLKSFWDRQTFPEDERLFVSNHAQTQSVNLHRTDLRHLGFGVILFVTVQRGLTMNWQFFKIQQKLSMKFQARTRNVLSCKISNIKVDSYTIGCPEIIASDADAI